MRSGIFAAVTATLMLLTSAAPAFAQSTDEHLAMMGRLRDEASRRAASDGTEVYQSEIGRLFQGENRYTPLVEGWGGGTIVAIGICDSNCTDLDLFVVDENDTVVAQDDAVDTHPVVSFQAQAEHRYSLRIVMYGCTAPENTRCTYGSSAFWR